MDALTALMNRHCVDARLSIQCKGVRGSHGRIRRVRLSGSEHIVSLACALFYLIKSLFQGVRDPVVGELYRRGFYGIEHREIFSFPIQNLPKDLRQRCILSFLSSSDQVSLIHSCRAFSSLVPRWNASGLTIQWSDFRRIKVGALPPRAHSIGLSNPICFEEVWRRVKEHGELIQVLHIYCSLPPRSIQPAPRQELSSLRHLVIQSSDLGLVSFPSCPSLTYLALFGGSITPQELQQIGNRCPELTHLDLRISLSRAQEIDARSQPFEKVNSLSIIGYADGGAIDSLLGWFKGLQSLHLEVGKVGFAPLQSLMQRSAELTALDLALAGNHLTSDQSTALTAQIPPSLKTLKLRRCLGVADAAIAVLAERCPELTDLNLERRSKEVGGIGDLGAQSLAARSVHLRSLNLSNSLVGDRGVIALAEKCVHLAEVGLRGCQVTQQGVVALGRFCHNLEKLYLSCCFGVTGEGLPPGCWPKLTFLNCIATGVTDAGIEALTQACPELADGDFSLCLLVSPVGIGAMASWSKARRLALGTMQWPYVPGYREAVTELRNRLPNARVKCDVLSIPTFI